MQINGYIQYEPLGKTGWGIAVTREKSICKEILKLEGLLDEHPAIHRIHVRRRYRKKSFEIFNQVPADEMNGVRKTSPIGNESFSISNTKSEFYI